MAETAVGDHGCRRPSWVTDSSRTNETRPRIVVYRDAPPLPPHPPLLCGRQHRNERGRLRGCGGAGGDDFWPATSRHVGLPAQIARKLSPRPRHAMIAPIAQTPTSPTLQHAVEIREKEHTDCQIDSAATVENIRSSRSIRDVIGVALVGSSKRKQG